ncbi:NADH dehydrogenase [ubiquinone] 1 beta subcomplex subunit 9-like [Paramacrobiotus metropolitanus]|uniref:NADH dehydrogenase [ubiquinone] 1 beta subcomplex subunit 9-like n=1 Tax=Paramacrobiotus metropolitanus TaxID=2943436 RepID=UPI0024461B69|nr:NADH dehydrogenase [ubiquinone] 1 beta subcomplex subunit 9-like [Paramacrobiotus metropolitanus]
MANRYTYLTTRAVSHRERVCSLYKKALRTIESFIVERTGYRYRAVLLRQRFDQRKDEKDMRKAQKWVEDGEEELFRNQHPIPFQFQYSPGGNAYQRYSPKMDSLIDMWHPMEKAQFPHYFKRREQSKDEFIKFWEKHHNRGKPYDSHEEEWKGNWDEKPPAEYPNPDHKKAKIDEVYNPTVAPGSRYT